MSQILHIFKKDARHLWPEIVLSLALTAVFVHISLAELAGFYGDPTRQLFSALLNLLVPVSWWVLILRLIHDESLVGDRQFWITRPYEWKKLLAAKALFLLVFLYLPFSLAQMAILASTGFHPLAHLTGFLSSLLLITTILILPTIAIATVTATFARSVVTLLGAIVYIALIFWMLSSISQTGLSFPRPYTGMPALILPLAVFLIAIVLQYATRYTWRSRWLLLALPFLVILCSLALPIQAIANRLYPSIPADHSPIRLTFDTAPQSLPNKPATASAPPTERVDLRLPFTVSDVPADTLLNAQAIQVSIDTPTGGHWTSSWRDASTFYISQTSRSTIDLMIDRKAFERLHAASARAAFTFAFTQLHSDPPVTIPIAEQDFAVPNGGICSPGSIPGFSTVCRFAFAEPRLLLSTAKWSRDSCPPPGSFNFSNKRWIGAAEPGFAEFGINPIQTRPLIFANRTGPVDHSCEVTQITSTTYTVVRRLQTTFTTPEVDLTKYALDDHEKFPSGSRTSILISAQ